MSLVHNNFSAEAAVEAVLFIAGRLEKPDVHEVLKIRYFADKLHLSRYGATASGDRYVAMKFGPVADSLYNLLKVARGDLVEGFSAEVVSNVRNAFEVSKASHVRLKRALNDKWLSESEVECLTDAIETYGNLTFNKRTALSHDDAWKRAWNEAEVAGRLVARMPVASIVETLENASEVSAHLGR